MNWLLTSRLPRYALLLCAAGLTIAQGVLGIGHGGISQTGLDARFLYLAGSYWHAGMSAYTPSLSPQVDPWLLEAVGRYDFAYPPQIAPLCLVLATLSPAGARGLMAGLNVVSALILAAFSVRLARAPAGSAAGVVDDASTWLIPALVLGNFSTAFVIWAGQTTLIVTLALTAGWYYTRRNRWFLGGLLLAIATIKPQLALLPLLWVALERRWLALMVAAIGVVTFAAVPISISGPVSVILEWLTAAGSYAAGPYNALGSRMVFGLRNALYVAGLHTADLLPVALLLCGVLWRYRASVGDEDLLAILVSLSLLFGFAHSYDIAALMPLVPAFWRHVHERRLPSLLALGLMAIITLPNSLLEPFGWPLLVHLRVMALVGALCWLLAMSIKRASGTSPAPVVATRLAGSPQRTLS